MNSFVREVAVADVDICHRALVRPPTKSQNEEPPPKIKVRPLKKPRKSHSDANSAPPADLKPLDQAGIDQQAVETAHLRAAGAEEKPSLAAFENLLLFGKGRIERQPGGLLDDQR